MATIFLYKLKNCTNDFNACCYIETAKFECGHYFSVSKICGPSWCGGKFAEYKDIRTTLTKEQYQQFLKLCNELESFGYGLDKNAEKKAKAQEKANELNNFIYNNLLSEKANRFANKIQKEEDEIMQEMYGFNDKDIEDIHNVYGDEYFDREIIGSVYDSSYDVAERWVDECCSVDDWIKSYIDYDRMGDDLVSDGDYVELSDGRVVSLNR